jgi:hypothetical protein
MFALDPVQWLLAGLTLILLVLLCLVVARRWHRARLTADQYRTASGRVIEQQSARVLQQPMATSRRRAGTSVLPPYAMPLLPAEGARAFWVRGKSENIHSRAIAQAGFDWAQHGRQMPGPYTAGTLEHAQWRSAYDATWAVVSTPATVQTTAREARQPIAA